MRSEAEVRAHISMKAAEDDDFRARLIADPRATVEAEAGIRFPDGYRIHVHEETATDAHVVLPPKSWSSAGSNWTASPTLLAGRCVPTGQFDGGP